MVYIISLSKSSFEEDHIFTAMLRAATILVLLLLLICNCNSLKTNSKLTAFRSTLPIEEVYGISGLYLLKTPDFSGPFSNSLTVCMRFKFSRLDNRVLDLLDDEAMKFLWFITKTKNSVFAYGSSTGGWYLKDPMIGNFNIWECNAWHKFCISYDSKSSEVSFIKVRENFL